MFLLLMLLSSSPLLQMYVGPFTKVALLWGGVILIKDLFCGRALYKNRFSWILALFCCSYGISILLAGSGYLPANATQFCYMILIFFLLFSNPLQDSVSKKKDEVWRLTNLMIAGMAFMTLSSLILYLFMIDYVYITPAGEVMHTGIQFDRLWGLYNPNTGSTLCVLSIILSIMQIQLRSCGKLLKTMYAANEPHGMLYTSFWLCCYFSFWPCALKTKVGIGCGPPLFPCCVLLWSSPCCMPPSPIS